MPQLVTDLADILAAGFLDGEPLILALSTSTVDVFRAETGHLLVRQYPNFDQTDWSAACAVLPAGTAIDPGDWEQVFPHTEILFVPDRG